MKLIFEKYVHDGMGLFEIARLLNSHNFKTSHGKEFERRSIEYILQNPTYCGMVRWNRTINESKEIRPESEWIIAEENNRQLSARNCLIRHRIDTRENTVHVEQDL